MEVYTKSSWFLLLLGFALIAATLQETADCPTPEQVSCTSGVKCNEDGDCQSNEKCCANACYTKRCIPTSKGVQGDPKTDGPSETDCRPYIEKALKELETGEAGHAQEEPSDKDESSEDVPTVEITDDSSHQVEVDGDGKASEENDQSTEQDATQQEAVPESAEDDKSEHDSGETPDKKEVEKSEEKLESEEETKTDASKEESAEQIEVAEKVSAEDESVEKAEAQTSAESAEEPEPSIVKREATIPVVEPVPVEAAAASQEDQSDEKVESHEAVESTEAPQESEEEPAKSKEASIESKEEQGTVQVKSTEASVETSSEQPEGSEEEAEGGCPPPEKVSCTEGDLCAKHRHCGENQICCPNKCYRKRCVEGTVPQTELDAESASEESEEAKSEEKTPTPSTPETGCPSPGEVSCTEGDLCSKHKQCGEDHICCPNKCYRRRCVPGKATSAELAEESDEDSEEEDKKDAAPERPPTSDVRQDTGCPAPSEVSCVEGDLCSKHKQCGEDKICCPNKCYRKRCVAGQATSAELAEESDEDSEEDKKDEAATEKAAIGDARPDTGCPSPSEVSCVEGDICSKHRHCGDNQICCPNKCYRKRCTPGTPTEEDLAEEDSSEETPEADVKTTAGSPSTSGKDTGCPDRSEVPCGGEQCLKHKQCDAGQICCANKCYRKVCVSGTPGSEEEDEESEEADETEESVDAAPESIEDESGCPSPDKVSCTDGERCGEDEDCDKGEICCPNKCYNKRCVPGSKDEDESEEEPPPPVKVEPKKEPEPKKKVEPKEELKPKTAPPPTPKKEEKKPEVKLPPPPPAPSKPITVVKPIVEEEEEEESTEDEGEPVEDLLLDAGIPSELRTRDHVEHLLKLDKESSKLEEVQNRVYEETLKELKKLYENAIKPLEVLYKYRDLSNRHFGDAEIFSKPLILFMGPWSGGKSSIINYLTNNEYNDTALRTGAEPSPAYFNILMYGDEPEIIDGTELAADFTFSGLQKFGQGLEERLRGVKLPSKLLEKVNIVEIPGILEVRKQVSRLFPFNDACQWFIDRADIIFLVYDPSKLDVGPETEAILDQLKGREHQTRIILNKADQVKAEELMRVQGALIWNISPLMSSPQPPVMYTTSLWSRPFEPWAPVRLLQAQERAFLRDLRTAVDRRVENKIASARRFAVRVRNHAKMVDCYLTTYYNHKSVFGNRKQVANEIIDHPQDYHIYEGLSTLTNISRYDLPDPDVYRDFFKLNPLYEFQQLSATCTYFRGCPINRLDIAIAYDLPELVGTYKRRLEEAINNANNPPKESPPSPSKKTKKTAPGS